MQIFRGVFLKKTRKPTVVLILLFKKNLDNQACVIITFENRDLQELFAAPVFEIVNTWEPKERKPATFPYKFPFNQKSQH